MFEMLFILMTFTHVILYLIFHNGPAFQEVDHVWFGRHKVSVLADR